MHVLRWDKGGQGEVEQVEIFLLNLPILEQDIFMFELSWGVWTDPFLFSD